MNSVRDRFERLVDRSAECWLWTGATTRAGYGSFWDGSRSVAAHRMAYELANGPIPDGLVIDHVCRTKRCVRPAHLEAVTQRVNVYRGRVGVTPLYCKRGHYRTAQTLYRNATGGLRCTRCQAIYSRESLARRADPANAARVVA